MERWIKLYEKLKEHDILKDHKSLALFIYLLLKADYKTGKQTIGRFEMSGIIGMKPSTYYKVLQKLEKKYDLVTLNSNNRFTEYRVSNWSKYQGHDETVTQRSRNKVETNENESNTYKELKNKELKKEREITSTPEYLKNIPLEDLKQFHETYMCFEKQIVEKGENLHHYCESNGKKYSNYRAFLQGALLRDYGKRTKPLEPKYDMVFDEERKTFRKVISSHLSA